MNPGRWCPREAKEITARETCSGVSQYRTRISTTGTINNGVTTTYARSHHAETIQPRRGGESVAVVLAVVDTEIFGALD